MLYMSSQMGNDGTYSLSVTFNVGTDLNTALVMVQNRVMLAMPQLPTAVQNQGITIRKRTPDILLIASLFSPDGRYDDLYLSNFAMIHLRDELLRVDGVSDIFIFGERDYSIRAWLNPQKMAALGINAGEVATAIQNQNLDAPAGQVGQPPAAGPALRGTHRHFGPAHPPRSSSATSSSRSAPIIDPRRRLPRPARRRWASALPNPLAAGSAQILGAMGSTSTWIVGTGINGTSIAGTTISGAAIGSSNSTANNLTNSSTSDFTPDNSTTSGNVSSAVRPGNSIGGRSPGGGASAGGGAVPRAAAARRAGGACPGAEASATTRAPRRLQINNATSDDREHERHVRQWE